MKRLSLILNVVLIIAVGVLYFLHFRTAKNIPSAEDLVEVSTKVEPKASDIVYLNYDSLMMDYKLYHDLSNQLQEKQQEMESQFQNRSKNFEERMTDFQEKVQKRLITSFEAKKVQKELSQEQQELMNYRDQLTSQLAEEEQVMNRRVMNRITEYLKEYNKDHGYQFIFSNTFGSPILYADQNKNITEEIVNGLNQEYMEEQND